MTDVFNLLETQFGFSGVDSNFLVAKAIQHSACVIEILWLRFFVDEHIVDVDLAYFVDQADLVLHTALKVKASSFQSHGNPVPLVQITSRSESGEFWRRWV